MSRGVCCAALITLFTLTASISSAAPRVSISLRDKSIVRQDTKAVVGSLWDTEPDIVSLSKGEAATVFIEDPNPLLYTYTAHDVVSTPTTEARSIAELVAALGAFGPPTNRGFEGTSNPNVFDDLRADISEFNTWTNAIPGLIVQSISDPAKVKSSVAEWDVQKSGSRLTSTMKAFQQGFNACLKGDTAFKVGATTIKCNDASQMAIVRDAIVARQDIEAAIALVTRFQTDAATINQPLAIGKPIRYSVKEDQSLSIDVGYNDKYLALLSATERQRVPKDIGTITVLFSPQSAIGFKVGAAAVWYLDSTFGTRPDSSGVVITQSNKDFTSAKIAAMVTLIPRSWDRGSVSPRIQFGVSVINEKPALLLGAALSFLDDVANVGGGVILRSASVLAEGQEEGDHLPSADAVKLRKDYGARFYFAFTVSK